MLEIREQVSIPSSAPAAQLTLPFDTRQKSRIRARLVDGREVGVFLPRGTVLRGGDVLRALDGTLIEVVSAKEALSSVWSADARALTRVAYHLGNRHVPVELGDGWLRYLHDHVLDDMVRQLGLEVRVEHAGFEPERGAYAHGSHTHRHGHDEHHHDHGHGHDEHHAHGHDHDRDEHRDRDENLE